MNLFEIELNDSFFFKNGSPFLPENDFHRFYRQNNIYTSYTINEFQDFVYEDVTFQVQHYSILMNRFTYRRTAHEELKKIININIYEAYYQHKKNHSGTELTQDLFGCVEDKTLYPTWQFLYIAIGKLMFADYYQKDFIDHIDYFKKLTETILKEYFIRNSHIDFNFENNKKAFEYKKELLEILKEYNKKNYDKDSLVLFLKYLLQLHYLLRDNEKYKLMWNLESTYILSTIMILIRDFGLIYTEVVELVKDKSGMLHQTDINLVYEDIHSHIEENDFYYANDSILSFVKKMIGSDIEKEKYINVITSNDRYKEFLSSIIEINKRFFSNKRSESTILSITIGVILNLEIFIKEKLSMYEGVLFKRLENLTDRLDIPKLKAYRNMFPFNATGENFFNNYYELIDKEDSIEKCLMLYIHARNYVAHNLVDFEKFFYENERKLISIVLDSILTILYYIETMDPIE